MRQLADLIPSRGELAAALQVYLRARRLSLRQAEAALGIDKGTLSRACRGLPMTADTYIALVKKVYGQPLFPIDAMSNP